MLLALAVADELGLVFAIHIADLAVELIGVGFEVMLFRCAVFVQLLLVGRLELASLTIEAFEFLFAGKTALYITKPCITIIDTVFLCVVEVLQLFATATFVVLVKSTPTTTVLVKVAAHT